MSQRVQPQPKLNDTCTPDLSGQQRALDEMACVCGVNFAPNSVSRGCRSCVGCFCDRLQRLVQEGVEEFSSGGGGGGEAGLQLIAAGHQGIDLSYDAVLFCEGW